MSYTATIAVYPGEKTEEITRYGNASGFGLIIWSGMAKKYLGIEKKYDHPNKGWMQLACEAPSPLWDLWMDPNVKIEHKIVHMFTFDRAYVAKKNYKRMAAAIRVFIEDMPVPSDYANHLPAFADFFDSDPEYPGVGLYCTSVSENPFLGSWNDEKEDYDPLDWRKVFEICNEIDELTRVQGEEKEK